MKHQLKENFPGMPEHYAKRIDQVLNRIGEEESAPAEYGGQADSRHGMNIRRRGKQTDCRNVRRRMAAVSAWAAVFVLCMMGFFTAFPAYAAEIPILNQIIYTISPLVEETGEGEQKAAEKAAEVLKEFMESDIIMYTGKENIGDNWVLNTDTLKAAYLFKDRLLQYLDIEQSVPPQVAIEVREVSAKRRGYKIEAELLCDVALNGTYCFSENIEAVLIEHPGFLKVAGMREINETEF